MVALNDELQELVKGLTAGYGESHDHHHAEKVAGNSALILSKMKDKIAHLHQNSKGVRRPDVLNTEHCYTALSLTMQTLITELIF